MSDVAIFLALVYSHVTAFYLGAHIQDRVRFSNPRYTLYILAAFAWPVLLPRWAYHQVRA